MRYARLAPAHKVAVVERLSSYDKGREPAILEAAQQEATGARTDTDPKVRVLVASEACSKFFQVL